MEIGSKWIPRRQLVPRIVTEFTDTLVFYHLEGDDWQCMIDIEEFDSFFVSVEEHEQEVYDRIKQEREYR